MNLTLISSFRNATGYIHRYVDQMEELQGLLRSQGHNLHLVLGYGDSQDQTQDVLYQQTLYKLNTTLVDVSHGGLHYGSIVHSTRFQQLAYVFNNLWGEIPWDADLIGHVESDLMWRPQALVGLMEGHQRLEMEHGRGILLAPMIYTPSGGFYDTWAFRANGVGFSYDSPYHPSLHSGGRYLRMDSVGSCFITDAHLGRRVLWPDEDVVVGVCREAQDLGYVVVLDKYTKVVHP